MVEKYFILTGYFDKQILVVEKLYCEIIQTDVSSYDIRFTFALRAQQLYSTLESLFKQIARTFESNIRPTVLSKPSLFLLDKVLSFRQFIRDAYDYELDEHQLQQLQTKLRNEFEQVKHDLNLFRQYIQKLCT